MRGDSRRNGFRSYMTRSYMSEKVEKPVWGLIVTQEAFAKHPSGDSKQATLQVSDSNKVTHRNRSLEPYTEHVLDRQHLLTWLCPGRYRTLFTHDTRRPALSLNIETKL